MEEIEQYTKNKMYARALFDNLADCEDELSFKTGDLLTILEKNEEEMEGKIMLEI